MGAYYSYTQQMLVIRTIPFGVLTLACMPIMLGFLKRVGYRRGFRIACVWQGCYGLVGTPFLALHWSVIWLFMIVSVPLSGYDGFWGTVRMKAVGERMNAKYQSLQMLCFFGSTALTNGVYAVLFDAKAVSYWGMSKPFYFVLVFVALRLLLFVSKILPHTGEVCDNLEKEAKAAEKLENEKSANAEPSNQKKTN